MSIERIDLEYEFFKSDVLNRFDSDPQIATRHAFLFLESQLREAGGLGPEFYGTRLIDKLFHPDTGLLQPVSDSEEERQGMLNLFRGAFRVFRNPLSHRLYSDSIPSLSDMRPFISHLYALAQDAIEASNHLDAFLGGHEGLILHRKTFRLDIDEDGDNEIIIMVDTGPVRTQTSEMASHLRLVILDKVDGHLRRLPVEALVGTTMYGPLNVTLASVTGSSRPDIVATWYSGESGTLTYLLRWSGGSYRLINIGDRNETGPPTIRGPRFGLLSREELRFVDYDGDGIQEVEYITQSNQDDLPWACESSATDRPTLDWCKTFKWHPDIELLIAEYETIVFDR